MDRGSVEGSDLYGKVLIRYVYSQEQLLEREQKNAVWALGGARVRVLLRTCGQIRSHMSREINSEVNEFLIRNRFLTFFQLKVNVWAKLNRRYAVNANKDNVIEWVNNLTMVCCYYYLIVQDGRNRQLISS